MVWSAPMTAVANSVFTAAQFNQFVRDNLNETAPAKATTAGTHFAATGLNSIAERTLAAALEGANEGTASTVYTNLATAGPAVTVTTGPVAVVMLYASIINSAANASFMSFEVTGATSLGPTDNFAVGNTGTSPVRASAAFIVGGLTPGSNTFTTRYRAAAGTGTFDDRRIAVIPF